MTIATQSAQDAARESRSEERRSLPKKSRLVQQKAAVAEESRAAVFSYEAGHLKDSFGILCSFYSG
jgi:hypothetical protein